MRLVLKPLDQQTLVITGATSGIGLTTAREAAARGAKLVLAARNEDDLRTLEQEIRGRGGEVVVVAADVSRPDDVRRIAEAALARFGGFDTWVNDAGVSIWGRLEEASDEDSRRLFETNFWGMVNGSLEAVRHLKARGGAIINLGSLASDEAFPLQGMYCASKHAIKAFTNTLRMELADERAPISLTLIKPAGIDTPFSDHARNYLAKEPKLPPPVYPPEDVARAILHAAVHPERELYVGGASKMLSTSGRLAPKLTERLKTKTMFAAQVREEPARHVEGALHRPGRGLAQRGSQPGHIASASLYTRARLHPVLTTVALGVGAAVIGGALFGVGPLRS